MCLLSFNWHCIQSNKSSVISEFDNKIIYYIKQSNNDSLLEIAKSKYYNVCFLLKIKNFKKGTWMGV